MPATQKSISPYPTVRSALYLWIHIDPDVFRHNLWRFMTPTLILPVLIKLNSAICSHPWILFHAKEFKLACSIDLCADRRTEEVQAKA